MTNLPTVAVVLVFLLVSALINLRGIKEPLGANVAATLVELSGLVLVVGLGAWMMSAETPIRAGLPSWEPPRMGSSDLCRRVPCRPITRS
ncbi:hypothetical protein [Nocardia rhamnosiphila]